MEKATKIVAIIATVIGILALGLFFFTGAYAQKPIDFGVLLIFSFGTCLLAHLFWFIDRSSEGEKDDILYFQKSIIAFSVSTILLFLIWLSFTIFT